MTNQVRNAIRESEQNNGIVTIDAATEADIADLESQCDGSVNANGVREFWADDPDSAEGMTWRVHAVAVAAI